jgi:hypothetical protein
VNRQSIELGFSINVHGHRLSEDAAFVAADPMDEGPQLGAQGRVDERKEVKVGFPFFYFGAEVAKS